LKHNFASTLQLLMLDSNETGWRECPLVIVIENCVKFGHAVKRFWDSRADRHTDRHIDVQT